MRGQLIARTVSLALLLLVFTSLIWTSAADEPNQAGLVVQFADSRVETRCVTFEGDSITGADLLALSGLDTIVDPSSGMGVTVCQIEGEGCAHPAEPCFCQCMGGGECAYWNYFSRDAGQADWTYSALGAAIHKIKPGSVEGWVWGDGHTPPPNGITFEVVCAPPTPAPAPTETGEPLTPVLTPPTISPSDTAGPTAPPTSLPATAAPEPSPSESPTPSPGPTQAPGAETTSRPSGVLAFVLMVAGLALVGGLVWLWRR